SCSLSHLFCVEVRISPLIRWPNLLCHYKGKKAYSRRKDVVHLLTYQSSKGLEFPYVAVINASFIPSGVADESEVIPVLYVAFTRATRELLVTCYRENSISRHLEDFA
ncbi:ATP-binding domain-containing protein, partial [Escherichia coli]